ncbi:hypothetical protein GCM10028807_01470 [Spirosoma daeguense]
MTKLYLTVTAVLGLTVFASSLAVAQTSPLLALNATSAVKPLIKKLASATFEEVPIHFCGETVPVHDPAITDRWTRTLTRQASWASDLSVLKRRASVVFPIIEPILEQYRIPADFKFLPLLESAVTNRAVSRKGAAGFWQLMPQTAQSLGLSVSRRRDDRFNLLKATHAACRYINELYDQLGSWMLVATAYNAGPNYIQKLARQYPDRHPMALPYRAAETKAYLFQTVAIKELLTRPQAYRAQFGEALASLSNQAVVQSWERANILASFDMDEETFAKVAAKDEESEDEPTFVADSTTNVVLIVEDKEQDTAPTIVAATANKETVNATSLAPVSDVAVNRLITRSLSEGPLTEGKLCVFQVVQPVSLNGRNFAVGDLIQAHIEIIDTSTGRVFLRTDQGTAAQNRETFPLRLVATDKPKQPGVPKPSHLEGWQLTWEAL